MTNLLLRDLGPCESISDSGKSGLGVGGFHTLLAIPEGIEVCELHKKGRETELISTSLHRDIEYYCRGTVAPLSY